MEQSGVSRRALLKGSMAAVAGVALSPLLRPSEKLPAASEAVTPDVGNLPNVVIIHSDQLRACSVGCYGNDEISTPHLDQMAAEGALFSRAVSTSPVCTPARACLQTGRYPTATGVIKSGNPLAEEEVALAEALRPHRYKTGYIGKWHLAGGEDPDPCVDPGWVPPEKHHGYRFWLGYQFGHVYYGSNYYLNDSSVMRTIAEGMYEPDFQTQEAIRFMSKQRGGPFLLMLSIGTPHGTNCHAEYPPPGGDYMFPYDPETLTLRPNVDVTDLQKARQLYADYYGAVSNLDWNVGRIMQALSDLGLADNTVVVFTSDHGDLLGSHYVETGHPSGKKVIFAESLEVPCLIRYPPAVGPAVVEQVFNTVDLAPTVLGLCGLPLPDQVMGRDFSPVLRGEGPPLEPPFGEVPSAESAFVGMFNEEWVGVRSTDYTLECDRETLVPTRLYDNVADPYQMNNVVEDPAYQAVRDALQADVVAWMDHVGA